MRLILGITTVNNFQLEKWTWVGQIGILKIIPTTILAISDNFVDIGQSIQKLLNILWNLWITIHRSYQIEIKVICQTGIKDLHPLPFHPILVWPGASGTDS